MVIRDTQNVLYRRPLLVGQFITDIKLSFLYCITHVIVCPHSSALVAIICPEGVQWPPHHDNNLVLVMNEVMCLKQCINTLPIVCCALPQIMCCVVTITTRDSS